MKKTFTTILIFVLLIQSVSAFSLFGKEINIGQQGISVAQQKTIVAQPIQQTSKPQQQIQSQSNAQIDEPLLETSKVLNAANSDQISSRILAKFEGNTFDLVTDKRRLQFAVLGGNVIEHAHPQADYTLTTTESDLNFLWNRYEQRGFVTFGEMNSRVDIPISLKLKAIGVLGLFGIGVN